MGKANKFNDFSKVKSIQKDAHMKQQNFIDQSNRSQEGQYAYTHQHSGESNSSKRRLRTNQTGKSKKWRPRDYGILIVLISVIVISFILVVGF